MDVDEIELKWKFEDQSLNLLQEQVDRVNAAARAAMLCPESPLWEPAHVIGNRLVQALSEMVDDNFDHISWYVSECDFGRSPKEAGCVGDMRRIDTVDTLRWLVDLDCEVQP